MKKILDKVIIECLSYYIRKKVCLVGKGQRFSKTSGISFLDGSCRDDIILERNVDMYGILQTSNHGKIIFHEYSKIGSGCKVLCVNRVEIGAYTAIGQDVVITDNNNHPISPAYRKEMRLTSHGSDMRQWKHSVNAPIVIGENVWIGSNSRICKNVHIGDNAIVAECSVVTKDVPANSIVAGNPAKVVKVNIE